MAYRSPEEHLAHALDLVGKAGTALACAAIDQKNPDARPNGDYLVLAALLLGIKGLAQANTELAREIITAAALVIAQGLDETAELVRAEVNGG